jgi:hypothetical protein
MLEVLRIIILTCQISGNNPFIVNKEQKKCQRELIECVDSVKVSSDKGGSWGSERLIECIKDRQ